MSWRERWVVCLLVGSWQEFKLTSRQVNELTKALGCVLISWGVDELTSEQERCHRADWYLANSITPLLLYSFTPPLLRSLTPYYSIPYYLLTTLLLTTYYFTTYYLLLTTYYSTPYSLLLTPYPLLLTTLLLTTLLLTTYYLLLYYSFLFQGITTFCYRQMGRNFRLYRIFVQYFVHKRGSSFSFYCTKTINSTLFIGIFKIKTTSYHTKR